MTKPFSPRMKYRILVGHGALVVVDGVFVPIARVAYGTMSETKRFALTRAWGYAVQCACGCKVWAPGQDIQFDHETPHVQTRRSLISDGRPLRRSPCHAAKSAAEQAITGKVTSVRRKLTVALGLKPLKEGREIVKGRVWPSRSLTDPRWKRGFNGHVERRA